MLQFFDKFYKSVFNSQQKTNLKVSKLSAVLSEPFLPCLVGINAKVAELERTQARQEAGHHFTVKLCKQTSTMEIYPKTLKGILSFYKTLKQRYFSL